MDFKKSIDKTAEYLKSKSKKDQVIDVLKDSVYKTEFKKNMAKIWFHEWNGWNYRVYYFFKKNKTKIVRYYTNGHENRDDSEQILNDIHILKDHSDVESLIY